MAASNRNDVLASNLLFATLAIVVCEQVYGLLAPGTHFYAEGLPATAPWWRKLALLTLSLLLRGAFYYGVRRGVLAVKVLLALGFVVWLCRSTEWQQGYVGGLNFAHFTGWAFLALLRNLLTLVAFVLMFRKPRVATT